MNRLKFVLVLISSLMLVMTSVASAQTGDVIKGSTTTGHAYRGGNPAIGGVLYASSVQTNVDPAKEVTAVRGAGHITKIRNAKDVRITRVALGTSVKAVAVNVKLASSGAASNVLSYTAWVTVRPNTCTSYRVRTNYSVIWNDGGVSSFSILSPLTSVCGPKSPPKYTTCASMNKVFPHGVGRPGAIDHTTGTRVTNFYVSSFIYNANASARDADKDGIACEHH